MKTFPVEVSVPFVALAWTVTAWYTAPVELSTVTALWKYSPLRYVVALFTVVVAAA